MFLGCFGQILGVFCEDRPGDGREGPHVRTPRSSILDQIDLMVLMFNVVVDGVRRFLERILATLPEEEEGARCVKLSSVAPIH